MSENVTSRRWRRGYCAEQFQQSGHEGLYIVKASSASALEEYQLRLPGRRFGAIVMDAAITLLKYDHERRSPHYLSVGANAVTFTSVEVPIYALARIEARRVSAPPARRAIKDLITKRRAGDFAARSPSAPPRCVPLLTTSPMNLGR